VGLREGKQDGVACAEASTALMITKTVTVRAEERVVVVEVYSADGSLWTSDPGDLERIRQRRQALYLFLRRLLHQAIRDRQF
jgi:hypothetical protein